MIDMEKVEEQSSLKNQIELMTKKFLEEEILKTYLSKAEMEMKVNDFDFDINLKDIKQNIETNHKLIFNIKR